MKTYVIVGTGGRSRLFREAVIDFHKDSSKLSAICDSNEGRLELAKNELKAKIGEVAGYPAEDFDKMLAEHKPDYVIVCTMDSTHDDYICRALRAGCDVITEKPMTTDEKRCQRIVDAVNQTKRSVRVTFNYRYSPYRSQVKELLMSGVIGSILSASFQWLLDTKHGADYFRRWHRNKANSGGLMVHKATHHFDLVNWWLSSTPKTVFAKGGRFLYTPRQADLRGLQGRTERCLDCPVAGKCNFYLNMREFATIKQLYLDNEKYDGYFRDRCIFSDKIDIEDSMAVIVQYQSNAILSYNLNAFTPWEGYRVEFNGTKGRLEHYCQEASYINSGDTVEGAIEPEGTSIRIFPHFKTPYNVAVNKGGGSHGGGDVVMFNDIFGTPHPDPLKRAADYVQGAYSILTGIAANKSIASGKMIFVDELVTGLGDPGFPEMPDPNEQIRYISNAERWVGGKREEANIPKTIAESGE